MFSNEMDVTNTQTHMHACAHAAFYREGSNSIFTWFACWTEGITPQSPRSNKDFGIEAEPQYWLHQLPAVRHRSRSNVTAPNLSIFAGKVSIRIPNEQRAAKVK